MQGAPKRQVNAQVNAEDMLAELKRALETSTPAPDAPLRAASTAAKPRSPGPETRRSQIDRGSDRPAKANAKTSIGRRTDLQKSTRPGARSWKLIAGGVALAGAAIIGVSFALMNKAPDLAEHEPSVAATESVVRPQNGQTVEPANSPRAPMQDSPQAAPSQAGDLVTPPAAPTFAPAPLNQGATLVTTHRIRPDGTPIATAPSTPASPDSAPSPAEAPKTAAPSAASKANRPDGPPIASAPPSPASPVSTPPLAETPKPAAPSIASKATRPDGAPIASARSTPASLVSTPPLAQAPKTAAPSAASSQATKPDGAPIAIAPPTPASPVSTPPLAEAPKTAAPSAASQATKPDGTPIATAPSAPAPTQLAPLAERPKPNATPTASNESAEPSAPKIDLKKKPLVQTARQRLLGSPKPPVKPIAQAERQSTEPARPKEAEKSPQPAQDAGSPPAAAPVKTTSVQQRVADGVTHAFGYLVRLPGALVPHLGGPNPDAH
jgi:hypothetical protein